MTRAHAIACAFILAGCFDDGTSGGNLAEQITRVELVFTPEGGGTPVTAAFSDPDGDGGMSGSSEPVMLAANTSYALAITFANELFDPPEDITADVEAECEEHQILVHGDAPVMHAYADMESQYCGNEVGDDLPVGLASTIATTDAGTGTLSVMLRHMPELNGAPQKEAGLAERLANGEPLPGEVDADVDFAVAVQ